MVPVLQLHLALTGLWRRLPRPAPTAPLPQLELQAMLNEKRAELERLNTQHESLQRVEQEQKALIEKLTNNEA